jgi:prolyl-tRNA editing enzyme YbaK/EbsC (Cys-tRNA(Pro) deacylase)
MSKPLKPSAEKVQQAVLDLGFDFTILEFSETTRTSADAAEAIGCTIGQIAKTLVFRTVDSRQPVLIIASGANRVDEKKLGEVLGEPIKKANANFVRDETGFAIGGIPPIGHLAPLTTLIDRDLFQYSQIWAAAGTPNAVFPLTPDALEKMTGGKVISIQ